MLQNTIYVLLVLSLLQLHTSNARNALLQPFASWSIWNLPLGKDAVFVHANINLTSSTTIEADPDIILLDPTQPMTEFYFSSAAWTGASRCEPDSPDSPKLMLKAPFPPNFIVPSDGNNYGISILMPDKQTIKQTQPVCHCEVSSKLTTYSNSPDVNLFGDGIRGAHGGSGLSAIGGTIRLGEFIPDKNGDVTPVRHALKSNLWAAVNYYRLGKDPSTCFRWPAWGCDGYFDDGKKDQYGGQNPAVRPGSLLALANSIDISKLGLLTVPATYVAWTLQNYGLYLVDDSFWDAIALETEFSPSGDYQKQFYEAWNMTFRSNSNNWAKDIQNIFKHLSVVDNWKIDLYQIVCQSNGTLGVGGGAPLQPWASPPSF